MFDETRESIQLKDIKNNLCALMKAGKQVRAKKKLLNCKGVERLSSGAIEALFLEIGRSLNVSSFCIGIDMDGELYQQFQDHQDNFSTTESGEISLRLRAAQYYCNAIKRPKTLIRPVVVLAAIGLPTAMLLSYATTPKIQSETLTIGVLYAPQNQEAMESYLEDVLKPSNIFEFFRNQPIEVIVQGDSSISYQEVKEKIRSKEWDIVFATSPVLSIYAKQNGYTWMATMFPGSDTYRAGLFVRRDNPIQSIDDINSNTSIALGSVADSASSFFIPVYDLFGKSLRVFSGNRGREIIRMVESGQVDVGAAAISDNRISGNQSLRIILESREIPGSGVYLSPELSASDRRTIQRKMLIASDDIRKDFNYDEGNEPDYTEFIKIMERVEEVLICSDFSLEMVSLYCSDGIQVIQGRVNSWRAAANGYIFSIKDIKDGSLSHDIFVERQALQESFQTDNPSFLIDKNIQVKAPVSSKDENSRVVITVSRSNQISVLD